MPRPTKYNQETAKKIADAIKVGSTYELAAAYAGISYDTFNEWRKAKAEFSELIKSAEGGAAIKWLALIDKAAQDGTWQAAAWKLERRYPESYGRTVISQQHSGTIDIGKLSDDELRTIAEG